MILLNTVLNIGMAIWIKKLFILTLLRQKSDTYYPPTIEIAADIEYTIEAIIEEIEKIRKQDEKEES